MFTVNDFEVKFRHDYTLDPNSGTAVPQYFLVKDKARLGFMKTTCSIFVEGNLFVEGNVVLDVVDYQNNNFRLNKLEGRRRALDKALRRSVFNRTERREFWNAFENRLQEDRERNFLPQLRKDILHLLRLYVTSGGDLSSIFEPFLIIR